MKQILNNTNIKFQHKRIKNCTALTLWQETLHHHRHLFLITTIINIRSRCQIFDLKVSWKVFLSFWWFPRSSAFHTWRFKSGKKSVRSNKPQKLWKYFMAIYTIYHSFIHYEQRNKSAPVQGYHSGADISNVKTWSSLISMNLHSRGNYWQNYFYDTDNYRPNQMTNSINSLNKI